MDFVDFKAGLSNLNLTLPFIQIEQKSKRYNPQLLKKKKKKCQRNVDRKLIFLKWLVNVFKFYLIFHPAYGVFEMLRIGT